MQQFQRRAKSLRAVHVYIALGIIVISTPVQDRDSTLLESLNGPTKAGHLECDVLDAFASFAQELPPTRIAPHWLDQFQSSPTELYDRQLCLPRLSDGLGTLPSLRGPA